MAATILFAALLFRRFVASWIALLGAILLVLTVRLDAKLISYKPETFAFALALAAVWLVDRAITERSPRIGLVAAGISALVFASHAEVFLILVVLIVAIAIIRGPIRFDRGRLGLRFRRSWTGVAMAAGVLVAGVALGTLVNAAAAGEFRILGYVTGAAAPPEVSEPIPAERLPVDWPLSSDPTWNFYVAAAAPSSLGTPPPTRFTDSRLLARAVLQVWPGLDGRKIQNLILLAAFVGIPYLAWPWLDPRRRRLLALGALFAIGLLVGSFLLNELASTYVPRRAGGRRLMPYELILPVISAVVWLWAAGRALRPAWTRLVGAKYAALASGIALVIVVAAAAAPAPTSGDVDDAAGLTPVGYEAYAWIRDNTPPDARILANAYTDGSMTALTDRSSILDGRAVYLEDAAFLNEATRLVLATRRYFQTPSNPLVASFLDDVQADYLLVVGPTGTGADLAGYRPFPTDFAGLASNPGLSLEKEWGDGALMLYRIDRQATVSVRSASATIDGSGASSASPPPPSAVRKGSQLPRPG